MAVLLRYKVWQLQAKCVSNNALSVQSEVQPQIHINVGTVIQTSVHTQSQMQPVLHLPVSAD